MGDRGGFRPAVILLGAIVVLCFGAYTFWGGMLPEEGQTAEVIALSPPGQAPAQEVREVPAGERVKNETERVNLNTAGVNQLCRLPGVGEITAKRIIAYREKNGAFFDAEELLLVEGIGKVKYEGLKDLITIE
jgi:competence ComEA-like helix-hairpin-helix protein